MLKWAGGKRKLVTHLLPLIPEARGRYFEPFLGGGALFFALRPRVATLSDANSDLIACYQEIKRNPSGVIARLKRLENSEEAYYKIRATEPNCLASRAARLLYLATLSFNGIYRQNLKGHFNVPYGHKTHIEVAKWLPVERTAKILRGVKLRCADFEKAVEDAAPGDVVYFDPPYTVAHGNNGFVKYNASIFSWNDQKRLAKVASNLADSGCTVIVSNADHRSILDLYPDFQMKRVERQSVIAASSDFRKLTTECIFFRRGEPCC